MFFVSFFFDHCPNDLRPRYLNDEKIKKEKWLKENKNSLPKNIERIESKKKTWLSQEIDYAKKQFSLALFVNP